MKGLRDEKRGIITTEMNGDDRRPQGLHWRNFGLRRRGARARIRRHIRRIEPAVEDARNRLGPGGF